MLQSLELFGFKSFAERTAFDFADGITCVVGPNGSGKSNVVDGIKWILGDQSAKSLRGKEMTDVIFNGSAGRKPSSFAEASLTFNNTSGYLPVDSAEVKIGRRLYRSGDSEYLINSAVVRLKDVRELFMGTGAGTAAYSIIEQGRVDQILQANPATRRVVFEEAAGISRYKARKIEALRRLERVDQNLVRLTDIVEQTEARLNATRSQATKAAKYRELAAELREWWTGIAADDYRQSTERQVEISARLAGQNESLTRLDAQLNGLDQQLLELDITSQELDDRLRESERQRSSNREAIAAEESAIRHHAAQSAEREAEIDRLRQQQQVLHRQVTSVHRELADAGQQLVRLETQFTERQQALELRERQLVELQAQLHAAGQAMHQLRTERATLLEQRTRYSHELVALESRNEAANLAHAAAVDRLARVHEALENTAQELEVRAQATQQAVQEVNRAQALVDESRQGLQRLHGEAVAVEHQLALWREQRSASLARQQLLEDLDQRQEGLNLGVREILKLAAEAPAPPWNLIRGSVGDLLQAELDDAPLLEVALGPRVQLLVIDDLEPLVEYLNSALARVAGRVGFFEVGDAEAGPSGKQNESAADSACMPLPDLSVEPGVTGRADRLVSQSEVPQLAGQLLGDTWIVETLDTARRLSRKYGPSLRFVTLQGELVDAQGCLFVGHAPPETAVISRKSELRKLKSDLRTIQARIAAAEQELAELGQSRAEFDDDLPQRQAMLRAGLAAQATCESQQTATATEHERLQRESQAISREIATQIAQAHAIGEQIDEHRQSIAAQTLTLERIDADLEHDEGLCQQIRQELEDLESSLKAQQLELAKHEERLHALGASHERLAQEHEARVAQRKETAVQLHAAARKRQQMTRQVLEAQSILAELYLHTDEFDRQSKSLFRERDQLRQQRRTIQRQQEQGREQVRKFSKAIHETEIESRDLRHLVTSLEDRLREEYQLELQELVAQGISAYRLMLAQRQDKVARRGNTDPTDDTRDNDETAVADEPFNPEEIEAAEQSADEPSFEDVRPEIEAHVEKLRRRIKHLGAINTDSLQDLDELESSFNELSGQLADLQEAKSTLEDIIRRINVESRRLFVETFEAIRGHFRELYRKLFGGGEADIVLEDPDDVLECGIDIVARPPGKELRSITLLSGGEKTLTAVALLFAMFRSKPSPYCILDEVDAALDEANVDRYKRVLLEFRDTTQFIVITHRKPTMTAADRLYGVTMEQAGVSKRLTVRFDDVSEDGHFRVSNAAA